MPIRILITFLIIFMSCAYANKVRPAITAPIPVNDIEGFDNYPANVKTLIQTAAKMSQQNLTYCYGSADPKNDCMDCSGTMHYLLSTQLKNVPRPSNAFYDWVVEDGKFYAVHSSDFSSPEFSNLKPGDLLFWTGTYAVNRTSPISHVMMYLGKNKQGEPIMFGASDGRTYQGRQMWGVSVFDFVLPPSNSKAKFIGYSCIPKLTCN